MIEQIQTITNVKTLQERLIHARSLRGYSQAELARKAGCAQGTIGNVESGERKTLRELVSVARALEVSVDWLYDGKGPEPQTLRTGGTIAEFKPSDPSPSWPFKSLSPLDFDGLSAQSLDRIESFIRYEIAESKHFAVKRAAGK